MSPDLDDAVVERVNSLGPTTFSSTTFRYTTARRDPLSGAGARLYGGRWNPRGVFPAVYLALPVAACMGEVARAAAANHLDPRRMLEAEWMLHTVEVDEVAVLDLRTEQALEFVGLDPADITDDDWTACQAVGHAAWFLGLGGVIAPSATELGQVLTIFENRVRSGQLRIADSRPLTPGLYDELRDAST